LLTELVLTVAFVEELTFALEVASWANEAVATNNAAAIKDVVFIMFVLEI
jgi:hypothetical protein